MNQKLQTCIAWHPLGMHAEALGGGQTFVPPSTFGMVDQSESCGFRLNVRVINF